MTLQLGGFPSKGIKFGRVHGTHTIRSVVRSSAGCGVTSNTASNATPSNRICSRGGRKNGGD
eukprot:scaffold514893_cov55-Attheya_sp.AAC.1